MASSIELNFFDRWDLDGWNRTSWRKRERDREGMSVLENLRKFSECITSRRERIWWFFFYEFLANLNVEKL